MQTFSVVPHEGTWIEIMGRLHCSLSEQCRSPRGNVDWNKTILDTPRAFDVVPHEGTWIEIKPYSILPGPLIVVPHEGTWIEIRRITEGSEQIAGRSPRGNVDWNDYMPVLYGTQGIVVPHEGTWIEMEIIVKQKVGQHRRSPRGNVDWNDIRVYLFGLSAVVPHEGTWIEILLHQIKSQ